MIPQDITEIVDLILNWLNTTGAELANAGFDIVVKRVMFLGIKEAIIAGFGFIGIIVFSIATNKSYKWALKYEHKSYGSEGMQYMVPNIGGVFVFISFLFFAPNLVDAIDYFLNPEWHAISLILGLIQ